MSFQNNRKHLEGEGERGLCLSSLFLKKKKKKKKKNKKHSENADTSTSLIIVYTKMALKDMNNQSSLILFILISVLLLQLLFVGKKKKTLNDMTYNYSITYASEYEQLYNIGVQRQVFHQGAVAEWSKALIIKQKVLGSSLVAGNIFLDGSFFENLEIAV